VLKKTKTFLFTDAHVVEEGFLELINNILTIGMVPALFPEEEKDGLAQPLEDEMRKAGLPEQKEFRWSYFVTRSRENIHIVLAMSPAGDTLRMRCRNFPGLVSNTSIDWFFAWPEDALSAVAQNFLVNVPLNEEIRQPITDHIVMIHQSVQKYSVDFETIYKRKNYSTPKNYLDFIYNYIKFIANNRKFIESQIRRLEGGLTTLAKAQEDTEELSKELAIKNAEIAEKKKVVEELIEDILAKSEIASKQKEVASEKKAFLDVQSVIIAQEEAEASKALEEAIPALEAAKEALNNIKAADITEIKALPQPPQIIQDVCTICYFIYPKGGSDDQWASVKLKLLGDMQLLANLKEYDVAKTKTDQANRAKKKLQTLEKETGLTGSELLAFIKTKNLATAGLFSWVTSTIKCYDIYKEVEPKRKKAEEMKRQKAAAEKDLAETEARLKDVSEKLAELESKKAIKQAELDDLERKSKEMTRKLNAASKLITGLGSEQRRWTGDMEQLAADKIKLVGDCLSGSAFLSYCGAFNSELRQKMVYGKWKEDLI
jgi:dynein heavy chain